MVQIQQKNLCGSHINITVEVWLKALQENQSWEWCFKTYMASGPGAFTSNTDFILYFAFYKHHFLNLYISIFFTVQKSRGSLMSSISFKAKGRIFQWGGGFLWKTWQILGGLLVVQDILTLQTSILETDTGKYLNSLIEQVDTQIRQWMLPFTFMGLILTIEPWY